MKSEASIAAVLLGAETADSVIEAWPKMAADFVVLQFYFVAAFDEAACLICQVETQVTAAAAADLKAAAAAAVQINYFLCLNAAAVVKIQIADSKFAGVAAHSKDYSVGLATSAAAVASLKHYFVDQATDYVAQPTYLIVDPLVAAAVMTIEIVVVQQMVVAEMKLIVDEVQAVIAVALQQTEDAAEAKMTAALNSVDSEGQIFALSASLLVVSAEYQTGLLEYWIALKTAGKVAVGFAVRGIVAAAAAAAAGGEAGQVMDELISALTTAGGVAADKYEYSGAAVDAVGLQQMGVVFDLASAFVNYKYLAWLPALQYC